ncbi:hypothetical protein ACTNCH_04985 [Candidatus Merdisoma sp. HCP28S3_D10]|uniref:hypothetical protein n=1 Tax=unclassified Candidatus Merdisoma TaxID=3099611 RepID=UPI003F88E60A
MKKYFSQKICVISALLTIPSTALLCWLVMRVLYQRMPEYTEFVTGYTTWTAYYKQGDMTLANLFIGSLLGFFLLYAVLLTLLSKKWSRLCGSFDRTKEYTAKQRESYGWFEDACFLVIFSQFTLAIFWGGLLKEIFGMQSWLEKLFPIVQCITLLAVGIFLFFNYKCGKDPKKRKSWIEWMQCFLPLAFLLFHSFTYIRSGEVIELYRGKNMAMVSNVAFWLAIGYNGRLFRKRKENLRPTISLMTFLSLAVFASWTLPNGTISGTPLEMYHYGEISEPLHEFLNYGIVPYINTMPIHGVCDYFQAAVGKLLFDGTYASIEPAMTVGCVLIAMATAAVFYYFIDNQLLGLLCVLLFSLFGDKYYYVRWAFALPFIVIVFSKKMRKDFSMQLWSWTFISILSIAWNSSIGGACALATLPMILWECFHEKGWKIFFRLNEKEVRRKILPWYIPLLILGICFIPMFFAILRYIVENSAAILETTGDILREELASPFVWYATFGFGLSLLAALIFPAGKEGEEKKLALYALFFLIIFNLVIVRYTFVRTQFGERGIIVTTICSLFLILMIFLPSLEKRFSLWTAGMMALLFLTTVVTRGSNLLTMPAKVFERDTISDDYTYATVEETGIPGLGNIYITEKQKEELMNLNTLVNDLCRDKKVVDMTNQLSHYNILNKENLMPFSSTYNTNNRVMQTRAIEVLQEKQPEILIVAPAWQHDSGSLSTRNYYMYQYLQKHYTPCKYKNIIFLTNDDEVRARFEPAYEEFGKLQHIEDLKMLPKAWGNEVLKEQETEALKIDWSLLDTNATELGDDRYILNAEENYFLYAFPENRDGSEIPFLRITVRDESGSGDPLKFQGVVYFMNEGKGVKEAHRFTFDGSEGSFLIPLTTSPYWSYSDKLQSMMLDFISGSLAGKQVSIKTEFETLKLTER